MTDRAGRVWISGAIEAPALIDGEFGAGWTFLGVIADHTEDDIRLEVRRALNGSAGKAVQFYVLADLAADPNAVPAKVWLGVDPHGHGSSVRLVSAGQATHGPLRRRVPEAHPGLERPQSFVGFKVTTKNRQSFRRADLSPQ